LSTLKSDGKFYSEDLAYCHHVGFSNPRLPDAVIGALRENGIADGLIIDLGCNGGHLLVALAQSGYVTIGVDLFAAALVLAENLAPSATRYHGDVAEFALPRCVAIAALGEVLCYTSEAATDTLADDEFLQSSYTALSPGGVLLFDIVIRDNANPFHYHRRHTGKDWRFDHTVSEDLRTLRLRRDIVLDRHVDGSWR
jgi:SAM-dependent methyltransferase